MENEDELGERIKNSDSWTTIEYLSIEQIIEIYGKDRLTEEQIKRVKEIYGK